VGRPAREEIVVGEVQGEEYRQWDFTEEQYAALTRLTATLCTVLPRIRCDYPRDGEGRVVTRAMSAADLDGYSGLIGHYHIQTNKVDPGPAFQWERVVNGGRTLMGERPSSSETQQR
jgi:N-acetyl-anhydromuramyl-L-alanine amidase AmpD